MKSLVKILLFAMFAGQAVAKDMPDAENPYPLYYAEIVRIIDGDTLDLRVQVWPGLVARYSVRVRGIDAPEMRRAACEEETAWAEEAQRRAERLYSIGSTVRLENVEYDAFSGRVVADVGRWRSDRWKSFAEEMIERNMAVEWVPSMTDVPWCLLAQTR